MRWTRDFDQIRSLYAGIGWKSKIDNSHPWGVDLKATGWTGKQEGGTFFATISHNF